MTADLDAEKEHAMLSMDLGEDLELRLFEERHAEELFALTDRNRKRLRRWLPWVDQIKKAEDTRRFICKALEGFAKNQGFRGGIWHEGRVAGAIGFRPIDWAHKHTEIGYWIGDKYEGKGLVTRSVRALLTVGFGDYGLHRIEVHCPVENRRSRAIPERLGFRQDGVLREFLLLHGKFHDVVVYSLLANEWEQE